MATQLSLRPEQWRNHDITARGQGLENLGLECIVRKWGPTSRREEMLPFLYCYSLPSMDGTMPSHPKWKWVFLCPLTQGHSSGSTLRDKPRGSVLPPTWASIFSSRQVDSQVFARYQMLGSPFLKSWSKQTHYWHSKVLACFKNI